MVRVDPGSFRDPAGGVLLYNERVYRYFTRQAAADFTALLETGLLDSLARSGAAVETKPLAAEEAPELYLSAPDVALVVEHPRVPFISYVYEWPFEMLKAAALRHLETMRIALQQGFILKDATPYNIQFIGPSPLLIDVASFERYQEGAPWTGYTQFCRTFLNPLLLQALTGVPFQGWMRSSLEGIEAAHLSPLLSMRRKLRKDVLIDVVLQAWLNRRFSSRGDKVQAVARRPIPRAVVLGLINRLDRAVARLRRPGKSRSPWVHYQDQCPSYEPEALQHKERFVEAALARARPRMVWDLGCNLGWYSIIAARYADYVVAMDGDEAAVGALYERIRDGHANILPLVIDLLNPSPDQGWAHVERRSLAARGPADFVLCLALVHHLAISGNVPLKRIAEWLSTIAEAGVVEFVPKSDPMVQLLLRTRQDVYAEYTQAAFEDALREHFRIAEATPLPNSERVLYALARK
ncbi:MAG TPA: class I SAM-dependent methyltransferase [Dehalococcoidia bacterium]|nr:class I SAM-dependent methyltransferase [Dehalococcoidia bacterium]